MLKFEKGLHIAVAVLFNWFCIFVVLSIMASWGINIIIAFIIGFFVSSIVGNWQTRRYHKIYDGVVG